MLDPECIAGERVNRGAVGGSVVGHHSLNADAESSEVRDGSTEEADRGDGFLVVEHFHVDEPGRVVDADVDVLPAELKRASVLAGAADPAGDAVAWSCDLAELLDV